MSSVHIIYASTSGHTEYVVETLMECLAEKAPKVQLTKQRAEQATPEDLQRGDVVVLASGTWNTGGVEGQLNPYMHVLLKEKATEVKLDGKSVAMIALGDDRYFYTARAGEHLRSFIVTHGGTVLGDALTIVNEPYGQEERIRKWGEKFAKTVLSIPSA